MSQLADLHFLVDTREERDCLQFLNTFIPKRHLADASYAIDSLVFRHEAPLLAHLCKNPNRQYKVLWQNVDPGADIRQAGILYTSDGRMIFTVAIPAKDELEEDEKYPVLESFYTLKKFFGAYYGCITIDKPCPINSNTFVDFCQRNYSPEESY